MLPALFAGCFRGGGASPEKRPGQNALIPFHCTDTTGTFDIHGYSWGIDWHRLRSMQIRSFNEFSAERTKSLITSSSPRQVFRSLPLSLWSPTPAINTHHRTSGAGAKKCAPNEQASEIHPEFHQTLGLLARLRIFGCNDAKCANCRLGGSSIANVLFPSASSGPSPQSGQRSRPAQCILYSTCRTNLRHGFGS